MGPPTKDFSKVCESCTEKNCDSCLYYLMIYSQQHADAVRKNIVTPLTNAIRDCTERATDILHLLQK